MKKLLAAAALGALITAAAPAAADGIDIASPMSFGPGAIPDVAEVPAPAPPVEALSLEAGVRFAAMPHAGFDPYSRGDVMPQLSTAASLALWRRGALSLSVRGGWEFGRSSAPARSATASLALHRLSLGAEAAVAPVDRLAVFVRLAPAALHARATLEDASDSRPLLSRSWTWGLDTSAGLGLRIGRITPSSAVWILAEGGYAFAGEADMEFVADQDDEQPPSGATAGATVLPGMRPAGVLTRLSLALRF